VATQTEKRVVNAAGVVQGIALVTFPAASTILTAYAVAAAVAVAMGFLSFVVAGRERNPTTRHTQPG
jgi:hypothetical protein